MARGIDAVLPADVQVTAAGVCSAWICAWFSFYSSQTGLHNAFAVDSLSAAWDRQQQQQPESLEQEPGAHTLM